MQKELVPNYNGVDATIEKFLGQMDPSVAESVRAKYNADVDAFSKAALEAQKSTNPKDWAKSNCKRCHGVGHQGTIVNHVNKNLIGDRVVCSCATKNYYKWLQLFRMEYKAKSVEVANVTE